MPSETTQRTFIHPLTGLVVDAEASTGLVVDAGAIKGAWCHPKANLSFESLSGAIHPSTGPVIHASTIKFCNSKPAEGPFIHPQV